MSDTDVAAPPRPLSLRELTAKYPYGQCITGWDPQNPPDVEQAFRVGFRIGAERCAVCDLEQAADFTDRMSQRRGDLYDPKHLWSDRRAAIFRGAMHGGIEVVRARAQGVKKGIDPWLEELRAWADENPISLEWKSAKPPDPPEADSEPLRRHEIPKRLWGEVYGMWTMIDTLNTPVTLVRQRGPFIRSKEQYERLRATELAKLRESIRAHKGEFTGLETLSQYEPDVQAVWREELAARAASVPGPVLVNLADVQPEPIRWLWPGRIALGKLTLLCGDPGLGKSFVTLDLAARVSSGKCWPDLPILPNPPGGVVLLSAEDDLADTIRPRLDAAGADPTRVVAIQAVRKMQPMGQQREDYFDLTEDLPALETAIERTADCRLVVIDPLTAYLGKTDSHKNAEVRAVLAKLFDLATRRKTAVLAVTHLNKAGGLPAIYRAMGSLAFVAAARAVWAVVRDENDETGRRRLFVPVKNNLGADESGLAYSLETTDGAARVAWEAMPVDMRADDALGGGQAASAREDARQFVVETLTANGGEMPSDELTEAAKANGISERTFRRARKAVAEVYKEKGKGGQWRCRLKGGQPCAP
ncbi:MAG: AAA family ATPase [Planctomycetes bacterium]|nr:AAA family ATPase [Planctomycetota bacterium]